MPRLIKYPYPRTGVTVKLSEDAWNVLHDTCEEIGVTVQDLTLTALLMFIDATRICRDWAEVSDALK